MTIRHVERINGTPLVPVAIEAWRELLVSGWAADEVLLNWDLKAFYAEQAGSLRITGILLYEDLEWKNALHISLGYVIPNYRRAGIYRQLWNALVEKAREKGRGRILGTSHVRNETMRAVHEALGREPTFTLYEYRVPGA